MARDRVGLASWEELEPTEQARLLEQEIWKPAVYAAWMEERATEEERRLSKTSRRGPSGSSKSAALRRRRGAQQEAGEGEDEYID